MNMTTNFPPIIVPNSEVRLLTSESIDQEYRILIALPMNYAESADKYPVIYVLDPGLMFEYVNVIARTTTRLASFFNVQVPDLIVVGIGYPISTSEPTKIPWNLRTRDLTPTKSSDDKEFGGTSGGAEKFLGFIRDELKPYINSNFRTDPEDATIIGGSLGGLFALYVLFHQPDTFRRYVALSPSLWWDQKITFEHEREYANKHTELPAKVFLSVGTHEDGKEEEPVMYTNLNELVKILEQRKYRDLEWESRIYEGEGHASAVYSGTCKGIYSVFSINL